MVIITDRVGQLCNRLFHFSYFIASAIENQYKIINPCFDEYCQYFQATATNDFMGHSVSTRITPSRLIDRAILKYLRNYRFPFSTSNILDITHSNEIYDLKGADFIKLAKEQIIFTKGWQFKDHENLRKHRNELLKIFSPLKIYQEEVTLNISDLRAKFDCIVGVHIRRGDYREWKDGIYHFSDEVYKSHMQEMALQINLQGKSCCFFICSNEENDGSTFAPLNISVSKRHFITDLYTLSECDYIMGPPSTFSYWASFYGNKPLLILEQATEKLRLDNFRHF